MKELKMSQTAHQAMDLAETSLVFTFAELARRSGFGQVTQSGVVYHGELAGPNGMSYVLLREQHTTDQMLADAAAQLHADQDVVGRIKVALVI